MTVVGISMMWNEEDVAEYIVRHMLEECDHVIVADNRSTDRTRAILNSIHSERLHIEDEPSFAFRQQMTMNRLADEAREELGATWIVPFDADEWWYSPAWAIRDVLPALDTFQIRAGEYCAVPQPTDDPKVRNPFRRCAWHRALNPDFKVAFRPQQGRVLGFGSHLVSDSDAWNEVAHNTLFVRHLPFRSFEQAKRKLRHGKAALEATGQPSTTGWHWTSLGGLDDEGLAQWWEVWTKKDGLVNEPLPETPRVAVRGTNSSPPSK